MEQPLLVTVAIIEKDNKFLLIKRANEPCKGRWCFVGGCGAFKKTADPAEAVKIEVAYDLNCVFNPQFFTYNSEEFEVPTLTLFFHGSIEDSPDPNPKAVSEYKWFDKNEVLKLDMGFDHNLAFRKYLN